MLNLTKEQKEFLKENFSPEEYEKMTKTDNLDDILLPLDALITYQGFDEVYALTDWGDKAQKMYDQIYMQNEEYNYVNRMKRNKSTV